MKYLRVSDNGTYFVFMAVLYAISPLVCLIIALFHYKKTVSHFFFVAYAFFFGYQLGANLDLMMHYQNYLDIMNRSFAGMYSDLETLYLGQEPYHITFKYIMSLFKASQRVFSGFACAAYTTIFIYYLRQFRHIFIHKIDLCQVLVLLAMTVTVEFYWYFGMRFWAGCFVFMIFYCKHVVTGKNKFLFLTACCMLFHIALATLVVGAFMAHFLRNKRLMLYFIFAVSFVFRFVSFAFDRMMSQLGFVKMFYKHNYQKDFYQEAIAKVTQQKLEQGNIVYDLRIPLMLFFCFLMYYIIRTRNKLFNRQYPQMFALVLMMIAIANFGYSDYLFYERFTKFATLVAYSYLFLLLANPVNQWVFKHTSLKIVLMVIVALSIAIVLVQQRAIISDINLWLGNYFSDVPLHEIHNRGYK
ncbi:MAG: hypothetical protein Q4B68_03320 [Bacteroidales bacterium]|nr:hypothetical protein [Bacteroidales bacterium]